MKRTIIILMTLAFAVLLSAAQKAEVNPTLLQEIWTAKWITHPGITGEEQGVYLFKKEIELSQKPESYVINISADNRYILYVNGTVAGRGPTRGDQKRWLFETIDIASYLTSGENHIAVKVWNMANLKPVAQMSHQTGLIIQANSPKEKDINTNKSWKVTKDEAYSFYKIKHLKRYYASGPGEKFTGANHPWHWQTSTSTAWKTAKVGENGQSLRSLTKTGKPAGLLLYPTALPMMEAKAQSFESVRRVEGIANADALLQEEATVTIPANSTVKILLDQGELTNAYPQLHYSNGAGSQIKITYAESLFKTKDGKPTFQKGNRDIIDGKVIWGNYDIIEVDGGEKRFFEPLWWRCFRYVELEIETKEEPLVLEKMESEFTAYPLQLKATFECDNPMLKEVFDVAWHTQRLCAGETFYDCPYYEQLQYTGDTRIQGLITAYGSGDTLLWKNAIMDYHDSRFPFGLMQSRYPNRQTQIIATFSLVWITMLHDYMMHCNDVDFIGGMVPAVIDILNWFDNRIEPNGMPGKYESWLFVDWVDGWPLGYPPLNKDDKHSSILGLQYVYTLQKVLHIFDYLEYPGLKKEWELKANKTKEAIISTCWDEEKKMLADTPDQNSYSQHANILAILTNCFNADLQKDVMLHVLNDSTIAQSTFYFDFYLVEALKKAGLADLYIETLAPLKEMIDNGLTTLVEKPEPTRSDCHAWSASPVYYYYNLIGGIEPASPGFNTVRIAPILGDLEWVNASMPHRLGDIKVSLSQKRNKKISGSISLPEGLSGVFVWENKTIELKQGETKISM